MAKVTITMTIDVPGIEDCSDAELAQNLFDDVINYGQCRHLEDAVTWCAETVKREKAGEPTITAGMIQKHHSLWGDIMGKCELTFKRNK